MTLNPPRIAFYAPLKSPDHPVPSGDRLMARLLMRALAMAGFEVTLVSGLRAYLGDPDDSAALAALQQAAEAEQARIAAGWGDIPPDLWFCYHPYYKSPDLIGPALSRRFGLPYVTCEASLSRRRNQGIWAETQAGVQAELQRAALNLCLTARDAAGLGAMLDQPRLARLAPFIDTEPLARVAPRPDTGHIVTVAMMRPGDKLASYAAIAAALRGLPAGTDWRFSAAGDGPARAAVQALFADLPQDRIHWLGALPPEGVAQLLASGTLYLWPGCGEAYGLAYLEAQAAGLPVVAWQVAGVPEVVHPDAGGQLVPEGDVAGLARTVASLLSDPATAAAAGRAARQAVLARHSLDAAAERLGNLLRDVMEGRT